MIVTPVAKAPSALRKSRRSNLSADVLLTRALWLPWISSFTAAPSQRRVGRQPERYPAIDRPTDVPVQHVMRIGSMDVAEGALDRVSLVNCGASAGSEKKVDRLGAQARGEGSVSAVAGSLLEAWHDARLGDPRRLVTITQHDRLRRVGQRRRLGEMLLDIREVGNVPAGVRTEPGTGRFREVLDRASGDAERDAGDGKAKKAHRRQLVQGPRIELAAAIGTPPDPLGGESPIGRSEHIANLDILAAGAGESNHLPRV